MEFDLAKGEVRARGGERILLVSDDVMATLVSAAVGHGDLTAVRRLGRQLGAEVRHALGGAPHAIDANEVLTTVAQVLGVCGWGDLQIERWGKILVARLRDLPLLDEEHLGIAALLGGLFSALSEQREVACVPVAADGTFLVVDPSVAQQVWRWSRGGEAIAAIVARLDAGGSA